MKKFVYRLFLVSLPLLVFYVPSTIFLKVTGENFTSIDNLINSKDSYLIGYAYDESNYNYLKWKEIVSQSRNDILAIGSSRILQFRSHMFDSVFYNAGYTIKHISDAIHFLKEIPNDKYPEILLINFDQWMFKENILSTEWLHPYNKVPALKTYFNFWKDLLKLKYKKLMLGCRANNGARKIGLNAMVNNNGFRKDGSMFYGEQIVKLKANDSSAFDYNFYSTFDRIDNGNRGFEYADSISNVALDELEGFLKFCKHHEIYVIAFLPPFAVKVNEKMKNSGKYSYLDQIVPNCEDRFTKYGFEFWDMSDPLIYNSGDNEMLDGFHGGEVTYIKLLMHMINNHSRIEKYTDIKKLKSHLENRKDEFLVY